MSHISCPLKTVLFDLDGTLADTAPDLAAALNQLRLECGLTAMPYAQIRPVVSHGATALIKLGLGIDTENPRFSLLRERFLAFYYKDLANGTALFPGMQEVLAGIESRGLRWGIVTNKPAWLTDPLLFKMGLAERAACIVSGDTTPQKKPHPEPLLHACRCTNDIPGECLYIGDAQRDIEAGKNAGMRTLVALFGYLAEDDRPQTWGADGAVETPAEILTWIDAHTR